MVDHIKLPYNFVPLNSHVVNPAWQYWANHDIPFENGLSGNLVINLTCLTDLMIGDGNKDNEVFVKDANGQYFIPGSSLRGLIRTLIETISFSRLSHYNDNWHSFRDLSSGMKKHYNVKNVMSGWLVKIDNEYRIKYNPDCDKFNEYYSRDANENEKNYTKILQSNIDLEFDESRQNTVSFLSKMEGQLSSEITMDNMDTLTKYKIFGYKGDNYPYEENSRLIDTDKKDCLVLTGQIARKNSEFIFHIFSECSSEKIVDDDMFTAFENAYKDSKQYNDFWKVHLYNNLPIPIFFTLDSNEDLLHFGFNQLYRISYKNSVDKLIKRTQNITDNSAKDFVDTLFGSLELKGRIQISHATISNEGTLGEQKEYCLLSPKSSYVPAYIRQPCIDGVGSIGPAFYDSYNDLDSQIAGRKFYPVRSLAKIDNSDTSIDAEGKQRKMSKIKPIKSGASFNFNVLFHNLRPEELGSLAYIFDEMKNHIFKLGKAKSKGLGEIQFKFESGSFIEIEQNTFKRTLRPISNLSKYVASFSNFMKSSIVNWENSEQLVEFKSLSNRQSKEVAVSLGVMQKEDYIDVKKRHERNDTNGIKVVQRHPLARRYQSKIV